MIDIYDEIIIEKSDSLSLEIKGQNTNILQEEWQKNIIIKSVNLLASKYHFTPNIKITLTKNIPIGGGLGGGSSNAATIILALNQLYNLNLSKKELLDLGFKIGADVPFFLNEETSFVSGFGEILEPANLDSKNLFLLIINPNKHLSTKDVFESLDLKKIKNSPSQNITTIDSIKKHGNDLETPAIKIVPEIELILKEMGKQENCLISRMSGSGASCFGIFDNENDQNLSFENLQKYFPNLYIQKTRFL
jgi:4-diphosphocytidyl-2-C-methyl-D-erythritol kinase